MAGKTQVLNAAAGSYAVERAAEFLRAGELVAFPTETVYGLGAVVWDADAVARVFVAKGRPQDNPLIVHVASLEQVEEVAVEIPDTARTLMQQFWPGPLTLVLKKKQTVPDVATAKRDTVCVRMPADSVALALIAAVGAPLVAPSANLSGKPSPTRADHVLEDLDGRIAAVLDGGECHVGIESTVIDMTQSTPVILRPGVITAEEIAAALGQKVKTTTDSAQIQQKGVSTVPAAPGMKYRHYAPDARILLASDWEEVYERIQEEHLTVEDLLILSNAPVPQQLQVADHKLISTTTVYADFREADAQKKKLIVVFVDAALAAEEGLMNRLYKAAQG